MLCKIRIHFLTPFTLLLYTFINPLEICPSDERRAARLPHLDLARFRGGAEPEGMGIPPWEGAKNPQRACSSNP